MVSFLGPGAFVTVSTLKWLNSCNTVGVFISFLLRVPLIFGESLSIATVGAGHCHVLYPLSCWRVLKENRVVH